MMANSAKDPLWQAKVTAEVAAHPILQSVIEDKCTSCHMPMGRTEAIHEGEQYFSMSDGLSDTLSLDGVSCTLCHQIRADNLGEENSFSGQYQISDIHEIYGPYQAPLARPMFNQSGYTPVFSEHIGQSELCATCHTLFTPYVDNQGEIAGYFPEQTPYLEWKNSAYPGEGSHCQTCHMPSNDEALLIASRPPSLSTLRTPVYEHEFVGSNAFMPSLIKANMEDLKVTAESVHFDSTIAGALNMLQNRSVDLTLQEDITTDSLIIEVILENRAGHKFPTGFPSRRAWIHLQVINQDNDLIFESGGWNENGEINGEDEGYEPHHRLIQSPEEVQIYESVMQDVDGKVTHTLLRGASYIKDNRIPPRGFSYQFDEYESIAVIGKANEDPDFNPGTDHIIYQIPLSDKDRDLEVIAELRYRVLSNGFLEDLFSHETEKVNQFKSLYENMEEEPIMMARASKRITVNALQTLSPFTGPEPGLKQNYPNPFIDHTSIHFTLQEESSVMMEIYDLKGKRMRTLLNRKFGAGTYETVWDGTDNRDIPLPTGIYVVSFKANHLNEQLMILRL